MKYKLGDLIDTISDTRKIEKDKLVLINTSDVLNGKVLNHSYTPNNNLKGQFKKRFQKGDILYSEIRPGTRRFAYVNFDSNDYIASTKLMVLRNKGGIVDNDFLYLILSDKKVTDNLQFIAEQRSGTFPQITFTELSNIDVVIPDLETQQRTVRILSAIDQKIELNNQLDLTVHNNLNAIFEDWFIRKNYNGDQSKWRKEKLGNFVTINRGLSYKGQFLSDSGTPMINLGNIMPGGIFRSEKNKYYTGEFKNKVVVKAGDLVMANTDMTQKREVLGTPLIVPSIYDGDVIFSHHIYSIKSEKIPTLFLYYLLLRKDFSDAAGGGATGTTVLFLPKDIIENYEFILPDDAAINRFVDIAKKVLQRRNNIMHENTALETIRDALLPRLMSGEISLEKVKI